MKVFASLRQAFDRLSARERKLVLLTLSLIVIFILGFGAFILSSSLDSIEEQNAKYQKILGDIRAKIPEYQNYNRLTFATKELIEKNSERSESLQEVINEIAKKHKLVDQIRWDKIRKQPLIKKKPKDATGWLKFLTEVEEIQQPFKIDKMDIGKMLLFLEDIEKSKDLLFIKELEITTKKYVSADQAEFSIVVSTIKKM